MNDTERRTYIRNVHAPQPIGTAGPKPRPNGRIVATQPYPTVAQISAFVPYTRAIVDDVTTRPQTRYERLVMALQRIARRLTP